MAVRTLAVMTLAAAMLVGGVTHAQRADIKIGVVNVSRLAEQAPQYEEIMRRLEEEFADRRRNIEQQRRALAEKQETLQRDGPVMGQEERLSLERTIRDEQRDLQRAENVFVEDVNIRQNEEFNNLQRIVFQEIQAYAQSENFDLVVTNAVYASDSVDITAEVLENLQRTHERSR